MKDGDFVCEACKTKLNASDLNCWRCGSRNLTDMRPSMIGAGPFNVPIRFVPTDPNDAKASLGAQVANDALEAFGLGEPPLVPLDNDTVLKEMIEHARHPDFYRGRQSEAPCGVHRWLIPANGLAREHLRCQACGVGPNLITDYFDRDDCKPSSEPGFFYRGRQWK